MQIREQGKQVQLIRSPYDKDKKRCVQKVIHTFAKQFRYQSDDVTKYLSAEQLSDLTDDEKSDLTDWLGKRIDKDSASDRLFAVEYGGERINRLAAAIESGGIDAANAAWAAEIWAGIARLTKTLKKAGYPKPAKPAADAQDAPAGNPGQADLLTQ